MSAATYESAIVIDYPDRLELTLSRAPSGWNYSWECNVLDDPEFACGCVAGDWLDAKREAERVCRECCNMECGEGVVRS